MATGTRKKWIVLGGALLLVVLAAAAWLLWRSQAPYADNPLAGITGEEIVKIEVLHGDEAVAELTEAERDELIPLLLQVEPKGWPRDYERNRSDLQGASPLRQFRITLADGTCFVFADSEDAYVFDGKNAFRGGYDPDIGRAIIHLYNSWFEQYTGHFPWG